MGQGKLRVDCNCLFEGFAGLQEGAVAQRVSAFVVPLVARSGVGL